MLRLDFGLYLSLFYKGKSSFTFIFHQGLSPFPEALAQWRCSGFSVNPSTHLVGDPTMETFHHHHRMSKKLQVLDSNICHIYQFHHILFCLLAESFSLLPVLFLASTGFSWLRGAPKGRVVLERLDFVGLGFEQVDPVEGVTAHGCGVRMS